MSSIEGDYDTSRRSTQCSIAEESDIDDSYCSDTEWPEVNIPGTWGKFELEAKPWNDDKKPVVRLRTYENLELTEQECEGVLTERIVAACSSYLDRCPATGKYVLCKCDLRQKNLMDITVLTYHHYLQYLDLSWNVLEDVSPLGELPFLMYLDVSHNRLKDLLNFRAPFNLTYVNYSHNFVKSICDLTSFWSIVHLDLSYNEIHFIRGLEKLKYLQHLDLAHNFIKHIGNLDNLRLNSLNLQENDISTFDVGDDAGFKTLKFLKYVNLSNNRLKSLKLFENVKSIKNIMMTSNSLEDLIQLTYLKDLRYLIHIDFRNNPMTLEEKYMETCVHIIKPIRKLDGRKVTARDKISSKNKFEPSPYIQTANRKSEILLLEQLINFNVTPTVTPVNESRPCVIALVGPPGSSNTQLVADFYKRHARHLKLGINHTTRPKTAQEIEGHSYYFITEAEFKELLGQGKFMSVSELFGYSYGLSQDEMTKVTDGKGTLITHTDLVGAISLRMSNVDPILVLTIPSDGQNHYVRLIEKYHFNKRYCCKGSHLVQITNDPLETGSNTEPWPEDSSVFSVMGSMLVDSLSDGVNDDVKSKKICVRFIDGTQNFSSNTSSSSTESEDNEPSVTNQSGEVSTPSEYSGFNCVIEEEEEEDKHPRSLSELQMESEKYSNIMSNTGLQNCYDSIESFPRLKKLKYNPQEDIEKFLQTLVLQRQTYVDFHHANPGFFCETIYSDRHAESMSKLYNILKEVMTKPRRAYHDCFYVTDPVFDEMITARLRGLHEDIRKDVDIAFDKVPPTFDHYCGASENEELRQKTKCKEQKHFPFL